MRILTFLVFCAAGAYAQVVGPAHLAARSNELDSQIESLVDQVKKAPTSYTGFDALGSAYLQKARETGDVAYFDLAEQALKRALDLVPKDFRAADPLVHMALLSMGEHRFPDALASAQKAIAIGSGNPAPFAVEGDAYTDMGEYEQAEAAYNAGERLGAATTSPLELEYMFDSRKAYLRFLHGDPEAIRLMNSAITAGLQTRARPEGLAWLYFELGERYFQAGDLTNAEQAYASGIAAEPHHYRSLAGLAKVRAAQGRLSESVELYQRSIAVIPFPPYVAELADVYRKMGKLEEAQQQEDLVEYVAHLGQLNKVLANRELATFYADHGIKLANALELARNELEARHDIYSWDALAWVLYKSGKFSEARDAMKRALALGTADPLLLFHAGMIAHGLGEEVEAEGLLNRALQLNHHFHIFYADAARETLSQIAGARQLRSSNAQ